MNALQQCGNCKGFFCMNTLHDSDEDDENDIINLVELQHKIQLYMYYIQMCCKFIYIIEI